MGLFNATDPPAVLRHIGLVAATLSSRGGNSIGLLAGNSFGQIVRCHVGGNIKFPTALGVGGLVGENGGSITQSFASVRISGSGSGKVVGGLVGFNDNIVTSSYVIHSITMKDAGTLNVGGLIGENFGKVENSYARNRVTNGKRNEFSSYGGLIGKNDSGAQITNTYAAGPLTTKSSGHIGGLLGFDSSVSGSIVQSYWDIDEGVSDPTQGAGNVPSDPRITGLSTHQFQSKLPKGFAAKVWSIDPKLNDGLPYLLANPPPH